MGEPILNTSAQPVIWILGGPGSGKGTQCEKIIAKYNLVHISSGDLLRAEVSSGSKRADMLKDIMNKGSLVPNEIVLDLIVEKILSSKSSASGYLIDGYPREIGQGHAFEKAIASPSAIIYLEAAEETLVSRLLGRAQVSGRSDDNADTIKKRIQTFIQHNQKIMDGYATRINKLNAERGVDDIFADIEQILDPIMSNANTNRQSTVDTII